MEEIISENQFEFTKGRQILDCALVDNEIMDYVKRRQVEGAVFKVDFQSAYDTVNWDFLDLMLVKLGSGEKWIHLCISSASISVLVDGSPMDRFIILRGLRQGCPLSPLLFNIVVEGLSAVLTKASRASFF
ncbi:secreted RxLR effector protein 78-like [Hibiscus syriacus]|uniref:secreted RxLR effector protein 78-like n=1 Tax=Hibiscus syriacus TaxID=106335 RepID=UPI001921FC7A|nr:secreted RxLR effector protein 78-like [Hibiscus syriacus]